MLVILVLLFDIVNIGRAAMYTSQAASYGIKRASEQGQMTEQIAAEIKEYLNGRNINDFELYATGDLKGFKEKVEVKIVTRVKPIILQILPDMRLSNTVALEEGVVNLTYDKIDASSVWIK